MTLRILPAGDIAEGVYYTFVDDTLKDLVDNEEAPTEPAYVEFDFELDYDHANGKLTRVDLIMWLKLEMPVWSKVGTRPKPEQDEWSRFLRALRAHEDGHLEIFRAQAPKTYDKLLKSSPGRIRKDLAAEKARIIKLSDAYDHRTSHGLTQQTPHGTTEIVVPP